MYEKGNELGVVYECLDDKILEEFPFLVWISEIYDMGPGLCSGPCVYCESFIFILIERTSGRGSTRPS